MATHHTKQKITVLLRKCHEQDIDWSLLPTSIQEMCTLLGKGMKQRPTTVLMSLVCMCSFCLGHACLKVHKYWEEPIIIWVSYVLSTGRCKSTFHNFIANILKNVETRVEEMQDTPAKPMILPHCTWDKFGEIMASCGGRTIGLYDEFLFFFSSMNMYSSVKLQVSDTREYQDFLEMYTGKSKTRETITGNANFNMQGTTLTLMGFTQPQSALPIIEDISNNTKGFTSRILWMFPKPVFSKMKDNILTEDEVIEADKFRRKLVDLLTTLYLHGEKTFDIEEDGKIEKVSVTRTQFRMSETAFNVFEQIHDDWEENKCKKYQDDSLIGGLFSRGKSHLLRLAVPIHILLSAFHDGDDESPDSQFSTSSSPMLDGTQDFQSQHTQDNAQDHHSNAADDEETGDGGENSYLETEFLSNLNISTEVTASAINAAHSIVNLCLTQLCTMTQRNIREPNTDETDNTTSEPLGALSSQPYGLSGIQKMYRAVLMSPGKVVSFSLLNSKGIFRRSNVNGVTGKQLMNVVVEQMDKLSLGVMENFEIPGNKSQVYFFVKQSPPELEDEDGALAFSNKLAVAAINLKTYSEVYGEDNDESQKHMEDYRRRKNGVQSPSSTPSKKRRMCYGENTEN